MVLRQLCVLRNVCSSLLKRERERRTHTQTVREREEERETEERESALFEES